MLEDEKAIKRMAEILAGDVDEAVLIVCNKDGTRTIEIAARDDFISWATIQLGRNVQ